MTLIPFRYRRVQPQPDETLSYYAETPAPELRVQPSSALDQMYEYYTALPSDGQRTALEPFQT